MRTWETRCGTLAIPATRSSSCGRTPATSAGRTKHPTAGSCSTALRTATSGTTEMDDSHVLVDGKSPFLFLLAESASSRALGWWWTRAWSSTPPWEEAGSESSVSHRRTSSGPTCATAATVRRVSTGCRVSEPTVTVLLPSADTLPEDFATYRAQQVQLVVWGEPGGSGGTSQSTTMGPAINWLPWQHQRPALTLKGTLCCLFTLHFLFYKASGVNNE